MPETAALVENINTITVSALVSTLKATISCGGISSLTLIWRRQVIYNGGDGKESETDRRLEGAFSNSRQPAEKYSI